MIVFCACLSLSLLSVSQTLTMPHAHRDIIDEYYLVFTLLVSLAIQSLAFVVAYTLQFDTITDFSGATNFLLLALLTLTLGGSYHARNIIASCAVMLWATRLGAFLLFRVIKTGGDRRFDEMRSQFLKFASFWTFQLIWVWTVSLPTTILNSPAYSKLSNETWPSYGSGADVVGLLFFFIGFVIEAWADLQKFQWKSSKPSKDSVCNVGIWSWSRHPNYFSEMLLWTGIWLMCIQPALSHKVSHQSRHAIYATVISPIFITLLLLFVSGLPSAEVPSQKRAYLKTYGAPSSSGEREDLKDAWNKMKRYTHETSILFPIPPSLYRKCPRIIKQTVLLDWPMYQFNERRQGQEAIDESFEQQRQRQARQRDSQEP